jgi:hypothetical protein
MPLPRVHAFEFNDRPWAPAVLRATIVESLSRTLAWGRILDGVVDPLAEFLARSGSREVLDLGSGAGGPAEVLARAFRARGRSIRLILTDLFPRPEVWESLCAEHPDAVEFVVEPVDATRIPSHLAHERGADPAEPRARARALINVLHHFEPALARGVLHDAVAARAPVIVVEGFDRNPLGFLPFAPVGLAALALSPLLAREDRLLRALLVYATPLAIGASVWDGLMSTLRVYTHDELLAFVDADPSYVWLSGTYAFPFGGKGTYFQGIPRERLIDAPDERRHLP